MDSRIRNAQITSTTLGIERNFCCWLYLDYGDSGFQAFGGYFLAGQWGCGFIRQVLETVGVKNWEQLSGKYVRVESDHSKVYRIGHILKDKWFDPVADLNKFLPRKERNAKRN